MGHSGRTETPQQDTLFPGTPPNVDDGQLLMRGKTFPKARRGVHVLLYLGWIACIQKSYHVLLVWHSRPFAQARITRERRSRGLSGNGDCR